MRRSHVIALIFGVGVPFAGARADLSIEALGDPVNTASYAQSFRVFAGTFDYVAVQVSGDTFEGPTAVGVAEPGWGQSSFAPTEVTFEGVSAVTASFATPFDFSLTFDGFPFGGVAPGPADVGAVILDFAMFNGATFLGNQRLGWDGSYFSPFFGFSDYEPTRAGFEAVPLPGALFLGAVGLGLVGFRRRNPVQ